MIKGRLYKITHPKKAIGSILFLHSVTHNSIAYIARENKYNSVSCHVLETRIIEGITEMEIAQVPIESLMYYSHELKREVMEVVKRYKMIGTP